jgi:uncharacterized protein (TIGR02001 family)
MHGPGKRCGRAPALGAAGLLFALAAQAQLGASVAASSDYRYRGVSLSDGGPSLRLALNYDAPDSWYAGASATQVEPTHGDRYAHLLGYAGWVTPPLAGKHLEFGAAASHFTGDPSYDFAEIYAGLLADSWSARLYFAPDYFGRRVRAAYAEVDAHVLLNADARVFGHAGALAPLGGGSGDAGRARFDLRLGAGLALGAWDLQLAWVIATGGGPYPAVYGGRRDAVTAGVSYSF